MLKLIVTFHNFVKAPNKVVLTDETVDFIMYNSDFIVVLSLYSLYFIDMYT
jgi:hypothetical protein